MKKIILLLVVLTALFPYAADAALEGTVTVSTICPDGGLIYNGDENWSMTTGAELERGEVVTLTAEEDGGTFLYWKDLLSGRIVSEEAEYTFTAMDSVISLQAMFADSTALETQGYVTFADTNGRIYYSNYVADGESAPEPDVSWVTSYGYSLVGWDTDAWETVSAGDVLMIRTVYEKKEETFSLSVTGGSADSEKTDYDYNESVMLTADAPDEGEVFAGWYINGTLVSYDKKFAFRIGCDTEAEAVFASEAPTKAAIAALIETNDVAIDGYVSLLSVWNVPTGCEVVEAGILTTFSEGDLAWGEADVTRHKAGGTASVGMYRYNRAIGEGATLRAMAYVIYRVDDELAIAYSEEVTVEN